MSEKINLRRKNPKSKLKLKIIGVIFFAVIFGAFNVAFAARIDELRAQIDERNTQIKDIEAEIAKLSTQIDSQEKTAKTLQGQIDKVNTSIKKLSADLKWTETRVGKTQLELERTSIEISEKELAISKNREFLGGALREIHEVEAESLAETLLANAHLSDFFLSLKNLEDLESGIGANLAVLRDAKISLEEKRNTHRAQKEEFLALQDQLEDRKDIEENARREKQNLFAETKNKEAEYQKLLIAREKERAAILKDISATEDELRKLIDPSALPAARRGVLAWPVANPVIRQGFGMTEFAKANSDVYNGKGHNGIDLKAAVGTPLYAAEDGEVLKTGNTDLSCPGGSYGKWILIEHPNNLATLYAHLSLIKVNEGQNVKRGELIGYGGNTGYTTGPHLHFTVYAAGKAGEIRFGPSPSGRCKLLPFGGYLNPLDYL